MGTNSEKKLRNRKRWRIVAACFTVLCLMVELLGSIPGLSFNGWSDVFSWLGMTQPPTISEDELQVHFIDVGNADCILIRQHNHNMLIDTAETPQEQLVLDYLDRHGVEHLDLVISTHPHVDHMGMMERVIQHVPVKRFIMSFMPEGKEPTDSAYQNMMNALEDYDVPIEEAKPGTSYALGAANVQILSPFPLKDPIEDANQISVVARLTYGEHAFLFAGDAEADLEERMVASGYDLRADVLKVAHHGSKTSTSPAFVRAVSPAYAVISCGRNDYGHPNGEVVSRLVEAGAKIYRTDVYGDMVFVSDGKHLSIKTAKEEKTSFLSLGVNRNIAKSESKNRCMLQRFFFCA